MLRPSDMPVGGRNFGPLAVDCRYLMLALRCQRLKCAVQRRMSGARMCVSGLSLRSYGAVRGPSIAIAPPESEMHWHTAKRL